MHFWVRCSYPASVSALVRADHAVVPLVRVRVEGNVGPDIDLATILVLDLGDECGNEAVGVIALVRSIGLDILRDLGEQNHIGNTLSDGLAHLLEHAGLGMAVASRHGKDGLIVILGMAEEGIDEVGRLDLVFSGHAADALVLPVTPGASTLGNPNVSLLIHAQAVVVIAGQCAWNGKNRKNKYTERIFC